MILEFLMYVRLLFKFYAGFSSTREVHLFMSVAFLVRFQKQLTMVLQLGIRYVCAVL